MVDHGADVPFDGPVRFNAIRRLLEGVSQKALTQCPRRLERNGLAFRRVLPLSLVAVAYETTELEHSLLAPFKALYTWTLHHFAAVEGTRASFDQRSLAA